jgi:hypothetical protein
MPLLEPKFLDLAFLEFAKPLDRSWLVGEQIESRSSVFGDLDSPIVDASIHPGVGYFELLRYLRNG